jgi:hypothetical protein
VSSTSPSSIESQSPRPSSVNSYPRSTSSYGFESDFDTQRQQTHDPPADKLDAPGSTRYVPVVHHATHRCLTPTRKINSGENHYEAYKLARQRACPPFTHSLSFFALICSLSSLVVLVPPGGVSGYDQATGNEEGEREREKVGGLHFFLRYPLSISYLSSPNFTSMSSTGHCTIKDPLEDSCMAIYRKCKANPYPALPAIVAVLIPIMMMSVN